MARPLLELVRLAAERLGAEGMLNARLEAELLLGHLLGLSRLELYLQHERPLAESEVAAYRSVLKRRLRGEPLQYILGEVQFRELRLGVDRRALIPRAETEVLVGEVLRWAGRLEMEQRGAARQALEIGTGSGAIALSLLKEGPFERVVATDISGPALELAAENGRLVGLAERVEFRRGSLWDVVSPAESFDVVVSNPPYVGELERGVLSREVVEWEPAEALFAGLDGLDLVRRLVAGAGRHLRPGGLLALEVGATQAEAVLGMVQATGEYGWCGVVRDLAGRDRIVLGEWSGNVAET